jgi:hypothetical protein
MAIQNNTNGDYDLPETQEGGVVAAPPVRTAQAQVSPPQTQETPVAAPVEPSSAAAEDAATIQNAVGEVTVHQFKTKQSELKDDPFFVQASKIMRNVAVRDDKEVERLQLQINDPLATPLEKSIAQKALKLKMSRDNFDGSDEAYAAWGMDRIGSFLYNSVRMGLDAAYIRKNFSQEEKEAFLYMMEAYEKTDTSLEGVGRFAANAMIDPLTYTGVASLGFGFLFNKAGQQIGKEGIKAILREGVRVGTVAAIDTAVVAGYQDNLKQSIEISAGYKERTDWGQTAKHSAIAGLLGFGLGGALGSASAKWAQRLNAQAEARMGENAATEGGAPAKVADSPETLATKAEAVDEHNEFEALRQRIEGLREKITTNGLDESGNLIVKEAENASAPAAAAPAPVVSDVLPKDLAGAKPRYNYGQKGFGLEFESDIERALFITSQKNPSKRDADYRAWLNTQGFTDAEINTLGGQVRDHIKSLAKDGTDEVLKIGQVVERKAPPEPTVAPKEPTAAPKEPNVERATEPPVNPNSKYLDDLVAAIKSVVPERLTDGSVARLTAEQISATISRVGRVLQALKPSEAQNLEGMLRGVGFTDDQMSALKVAAQRAFEDTDKMGEQLAAAIKEATTPEARKAAETLWDQFERFRSQLGDLDTALSSRSGSDLASRVGGKYVGANRGLSRDGILERMGINPEYATLEQKLAAQEKFAAIQQRIQQSIDANREVQRLTEEYYAAIERGEHGLADTIITKRTELEKRIASNFEDAAMGKRMYGWINDNIIRPVNEAVIGTVFAPSSLILNIIPAIYKTLLTPALNALVRGGVADREIWKATGSFYGTMWASRTAALDGAKASFRYERSMISGDPASILEHTPVIEGLKGRFIRTFPRVLSASDEFFKRLNYVGHTVFEAQYNAAVSGAEKGLTGEALDKYVAEAVLNARKNMYKEVDPQDISKLIAQDADLRGLQGAEREAYVNERFAKDAASFTPMKDGPSKTYAENMAFTRPFSGDTTISRTAQALEKMINEHPIWRLAGQLFFRTPVRIYEEGFRVTPGLNLISPKYMDDLRGLNGVGAQVRAQGEHLLAMSIGASFFAMYGNGTITGPGPTDPKLRTEWLKKNTPYSITFPNGYVWEFKNMEPLSLPFKIYVNALDRMAELEYRKRQGEYVNKEMQEVQAWIGVATGTAASIFKDANLVGGIEAFVNFAEAFGDPEKNDQKLARLAADKMRLAVPSVWPRIMQQFDGNLDMPQYDPQTIEQMLMARINPTGADIPKKYDSLGLPMTQSYSSQWAKAAKLWTGIAINEGNPQFDHLTPTQQYVTTKTLSLEQAIKQSLALPYKVKAFGDLDLRTEKTKDGQEYYYDRIQRYAIELGMLDALEKDYRQMDGMPKGSKSIDGVQPMVIKNTLSRFRDAAILKLMSEESGLRARVIQERYEKARTLSGQKEVLSQPY